MVGRHLFRCSVDIAGISDLSLLVAERTNTLGWDYTKKQIGTDPEKLKLNSPRLHAADFNVTVLMLHDDMDAQTPRSLGQADARMRPRSAIQFSL